MTHVDTIRHKVQNKEYEIRVFKTDTGFTIRVVSGVEVLSRTYSVSFEDAADFKLYTGGSGLQHLISIVKADLESKGA